MNWYHRGEGRYVEYGTSFKASQTFGFKRSLTDTIYNMNLEHLSQGRRDGVRGARRRRRPHRRHDLPDVPRPPPPRGRRATRRSRGSPRRSSATPSTAARVLLRRHLRLAQDAAAARQLGLPGQRDQHAGCVGAHLVEHDLFDFLLLSLPDNDTHSHKNGPFAQVASIAAADKQIERLMHAAGGPEAFLEDHAMIVCSDHSQSQVEAEIDLFKAFDGFGLEPPMPTRVRKDGEPPEIAVCPSSRSAQVYVLDRDRRTELIPRIERTALALEGVDLVMRLTDHPDGEAAIRGGRAARCASCPAGSSPTAAASAGTSRATSSCSASRSRDGVLFSATYPDALGRVWSALRCRTAGRGAAVGQARLRVHRLGRRPPRRRRLATARCTPTTRWARCSGAAPDPTRGRQGTVVAARHRADGARALRRPVRVSGGPRSGSCSSRCSRPAAAAQTLSLAAPSSDARRPPAAADGAGRGRCARSPRGPRSAARAAKHELTYGRAYYKSRAKHRWQVSFFAAPKGHGRRRRSRRPSSTTAAAACSRAGRATRSRGRWRAATPARSGGSPTRCGSGCRCACCSCCRSRGRRGGCCTSTSWCCCAFSRLVRVLQQRGSTCRCRSSIRCSPTCWCGCWSSRAGRREPGPRAAHRAGRVARDRRGVPDGLPLRAERRRLERDRRRLRERDRRRPLRLRPGRSTATSRSTTSAATPTGRSSTTRTCRSRRCCRGAGAGTTCRPRTPRRSAFDLLTAAGLWLLGRRLRGPDLGRAARLRVGDVPVHAARRQLEHQRRARGAAGARGDARARAAGRARGGGGARRR